MTKRQQLEAERLKEKLLRIELKRRQELRERLTDNALLPATHYLAELDRVTGEEKILFGSCASSRERISSSASRK